MNPETDKYPQKVLIVEDEAVIAHDIKITLSEAGIINTQIAYNWRDALKMAKSFLPDLILMDIDLNGELDGINVATEIQKSQNTPIIFLTGQTDERSLLRSLPVNAYSYLLKPINEKELIFNIRNAYYKFLKDTEIQSSLNHFNQLLNTFGEAFIKTSLTGAVEYINEYGKSLIDGDDLSNTSLYINEILEYDILKAKDFLLQRDKAIKAKIKHNQKENIFVEVRFDKIFDNAGEHTGYLYVLRDITKNVLIEQQISKFNKALGYLTGQRLYQTFLNLVYQTYALDLIALVDVKTRDLTAFELIYFIESLEFKNLTNFIDILNQSEIQQLIKNSIFLANEQPSKGANYIKLIDKVGSFLFFPIFNYDNNCIAYIILKQKEIEIQTKLIPLLELIELFIPRIATDLANYKLITKSDHTNELLKKIINNSQDIIWYYNFKNDTVTCNDAFYKLFGIDLHVPLTKSPESYFDNSISIASYRMYVDISKHFTAKTFYTLSTLSNQPRWFTYNFELVFDENNQKKGYYVFLREVTQEIYSFSNLRKYATHLESEFEDHKKAKLETDFELNSLIHSINGLVYRFSLSEGQLIVEFLSDYIYKLTGFWKEEFNNTLFGLYPIIAEVDKPIYLSLRSLIEQKISKPYELKYKIIHRDGKFIHVLDKGQFVYHHSNYYYFLGVIYDISELVGTQASLEEAIKAYQNLNSDLDLIIEQRTKELIDSKNKLLQEKKQHEHTLKELEEQEKIHRKTLMALEEGVIVVNEKNKVINQNTAAREILDNLGYHKINKNKNPFIQLKYADLDNVIMDVMYDITKAKNFNRDQLLNKNIEVLNLITNKIASLKLNLILVDSEFNEINSIDEVNNKNEILHFFLIITFSDITKQIHREEQLLLLKNAITSANDSIIITNASLDYPNPVIIYANEAACKMTGYALEELIGRSPRILQGEQTDKTMLRELKKNLEAGKSFSASTVNYKKNGTPYFVEWHISPVFDKHNKIISWISIQQDVTERILLERKLLLNKETQEKNIMLAIVEAQEKERKRFAEELHDGIGINLSVLKMSVTNMEESIRQYDSILVEQFDEVRQLLDETAAEVRNISRNITPNVLYDFGFESAVTDLINKISHSNNIIINYWIHNFPTKLPISFLLSLYRIVQEALNNSIKYANAHTITLYINCDNNTIQLIIEDDGIGFDYNEKITKHQGIGLNNIFTRAKLLNGDIRLNTHIGEGCTYLITIPI